MLRMTSPICIYLISVDGLSTQFSEVQGQGMDKGLGFPMVTPPTLASGATRVFMGTRKCFFTNEPLGTIFIVTISSAQVFDNSIFEPENPLGEPSERPVDTAVSTFGIPGSNSGDPWDQWISGPG